MEFCFCYFVLNYLLLYKKGMLQGGRGGSGGRDAVRKRAVERSVVMRRQERVGPEGRRQKRTFERTIARRRGWVWKDC
jgi:hypothetical protein